MPAIGMNVLKNSNIAPQDSHFFGDPAIPKAWEDDFDDEVIFFCQIKLSDITELDREGRLPHHGYLYVFFDTADSKYHLRPIVRYFDGEPEMVLDEFNQLVEGYERFGKPLGIAFSSVNDDYDSHKLFGIPSDWPYAEEPKPLLMQIDHFDDALDFHCEMDGETYLFFGKDTKFFTDVTIHQEYS